MSRQPHTNELRRQIIKTMFVGLGLLAACNLPVQTQATTDPNATFDFTVTEITIVNNMAERDLTIKYYTISPSGTNYKSAKIISKKRVTKLSICKAMGFFIVDNATHHEYDPAPSSAQISAKNVPRFLPFCLNNNKLYKIPTKNLQQPPVYSLDSHSSCVGPI